MPQIGEVKRGDALGKTNFTRWHWFIWQACEDCGKERWVNLKSKSKAIPYRTRCHKCACNLPIYSLNCAKGQKGKFGSESGAWKGGRYKSEGYMFVYVHPSDFFYSMRRKNGYVLEHRLIMAQHLNRCLLDWEVVHHKNGIKNDNRLENLELIKGNSRHNTQDKRLIRQLQEENQHLKIRIKELELLNEGSNR